MKKWRRGQREGRRRHDKRELSSRHVKDRISVDFKDFESPRAPLRCSFDALLGSATLRLAFGLRRQREWCDTQPNKVLFNTLLPDTLEAFGISVFSCRLILRRHLSNPTSLLTRSETPASRS